MSEPTSPASVGSRQPDPAGAVSGVNVVEIREPGPAGAVLTGTEPPVCNDRATGMFDAVWYCELPAGHELPHRNGTGTSWMPQPDVTPVDPGPTHEPTEWWLHSCGNVEAWGMGLPPESGGCFACALRETDVSRWRQLFVEVSHD